MEMHYNENRKRTKSYLAGFEPMTSWSLDYKTSHSYETWYRVNEWIQLHSPISEHFEFCC